MSKESYVRGFCKVAEAYGVNPVELAKYAADIRTNQSDAKPKMTLGDVRRLHPEAAELDGNPAMSDLRTSLRGLNAEDARLDDVLTDEMLKSLAKKTEAWNPLGPEGYVGGNAVTNHTGIYHLPAPIGGSGWGARTTPLTILRPGEITRMPSQAAATNSPSVKYTVLTHKTKEDVPLWKQVKHRDGSVVNVPSNFDALINLQNLIGVK